MRIGVVGAGPWARETHLPALRAHPRVTLAGIHTRRPESAEGLGVERFADLDALLAEVDAVAFAVPPHAQAPLAVAAVRAGKHVILDKPIAGDLDSAEHLAAEIDAAGVVSVVTFTRRFAPETRAFLASARAGSYSMGLGRWLSGAILGGRYAKSAWRHSGGALLDVGPHVIDLLTAALGDVVGVIDARVHRDDDLWQIRLAHVGGATSDLQMSLRVPVMPTVTEFTVAGHDGVIALTDRSTSSVDCFTTLLDEFCDAVDSGGRHPLDVHRGLAVQRVIEQIRGRPTLNP